MIQAYPDTRRDHVCEEVHGLTIADPYRWLEDATSGDTVAWASRQNDHARWVLDSLPGRAAIRRRVAELMTVDSAALPLARAGRYVFSRRHATDAHHAICVRRELHGEDDVIVRPQATVDVASTVELLDLSGTGRLVVYLVRRAGEDEVELRIHNIDRGADLPDVLPRARYLECVVTPDDSGLYYVRVDADGCRVYRHTFGTESDALVFGADHPQQLVSCSLSDDGRILLLQVQHGAGRSQRIDALYIQDLAHDAAPRRLAPGVPAHGTARLGGQEIFLLTSSNAPNHRIVALNMIDGAVREVVPGGTAVIEKFSLAAGRVFVQYLENVTSRLCVFRPDGSLERELSFGALGQVSKVVGQWSLSEVFISFASFHVPMTLYRYEAEAGTLEVWLRRTAPVDTDALELRQVWYRSKDGTRIPMFLLQKRGLACTNNRPVLLTGYGGFGFSVKPWFRSDAVLWAEMGGVYAVANVRGGGELGVHWHEGGKLANKQTSFDDFISAAEHLIAEGYTVPERIGITGHSNGGLLVAAAITQRPALFRAAVCRHPITDMIRYHRFPVGRLWVPEYGSADDPAQCAYLYAYSPYHRVESGVAYPAILLRTGGMDTRVDPSHARKLAAAMQAATTSGRPVLLRCDPVSGHAGAESFTEQIEELADELSFLSCQLDVRVA